MRTKFAFLLVEVDEAQRHWQRDPNWMSQYVGRHLTSILKAAESDGGQVIESGDGRFQIALPSAIAAFQCAQHIREELSLEPLPLKMAIHVGSTESAPDGPHNVEIEKSTILLAAARGGQTLLTERVRVQLTDHMPDDQITDLGEHLLRGWSRPLRLYQVGSELFGPLHTLEPNSLFSNLARQTTSFVGREKELREVSGLLKNRRLVTLVGTGGCGKTRLALQCAIEVANQFNDGVWFVDLAVLADGDLVVPTVVRTVCKSGVESTIENLINELNDSHVLLVLDNCEHLINACADLADHLLVSAPKLHILATSRHPLRAGDEMRYRVPSLTIPSLDKDIRAEDVVKFEASRLFIERARLVRPEIELNDAGASDLASICVALGGIPLAVELAAAQTASMSLSEMKMNFGEVFRARSVSKSQVLPRQQTLRALIDWSYVLLSPEEKRLFRRMSVFAGSWSESGADQLCKFGSGQATPLGSNVSDLLAALVDKSVVVGHSQFGKKRFSMLPTIRHYAQERLRDAGEEGIFRQAHCDLCVSLTKGANLRGRTTQFRVDDEISDIEQDDYRAAFKWGLSHSSETDAALILAGELGTLWYQRGFGIEIRQWLHRALRQVEKPKDPRVRLQALVEAIGVAGFEGDYPTLKRYCDELEHESRSLGDELFLATALHEQGKMAQYHRGDNSRASSYFKRAISMFQSIPDCDREVNQVGLSLGHLASSIGNYEEAISYLRNAVEFARMARDDETLGYGHALLAITLFDAREYEESSTVYETAIKFAQERGLRTLELNHWVLSSRMALDRGQIEKGRKGYEQAIELSVKIQDRHREQLARIGVSRAYSEEGDREKARFELMQCWIPSSYEHDEQLRVDLLFSAAVLAFADGRYELSANALGATQATRETIAWVIPPAERQRWAVLEARLGEKLMGTAVDKFIEAGRSLSCETIGSMLFGTTSVDHNL